MVMKGEVRKLETLLRDKITRIARCDIFLESLGIAKRNYDIINTHFVAESATSSKSAWQSAIRNISLKLSEKGLLFMSALLGAKGSYKVLGRQFPAVEIYENDIRAELKKNSFHRIKVSSMRTEDLENNYKGFMFITAEKK